MAIEDRRKSLRLLAAFPAALVLAGAKDADARRLGVLHWYDQRDFDRERPGIFPALAQKGWRESANLGVHWRQARIDSPGLARIAAELVAASPHAILTESTVLTRVLARATSTVPIVTSVGDPVASGFAASYARPGGNITGLSNRDEGFEAKCIDILRAFAPRPSSVLVLFESTVDGSRHWAGRLEAAVRDAGLRSQVHMLSSVAEAQAALAQAPRDAAAVVGNLFLDERIGSWLASELPLRRIPAICGGNGREERFLLSMEPYHANSALRFASVLEKIFRGTPAADIAFERPDAAHIVVNRRIAKAMGLTVPAEMMLRATRFVD